MNIMSKMRDSGWQNLTQVNYSLDKILKIQSKYNKKNSLSELINETRDVIIAFNLGMESKEARKEALNVIKPVTYKQANNFIERVDSIMSQNENFLTFPKTISGVQKTYENIIGNGKIEDVAFLFGIDEIYLINVYHSMVLRKEIDEYKSPGTKFLQEITDEMFLRNEEKKEKIITNEESKKVDTIKENNVIQGENLIKENEEVKTNYIPPVKKSDTPISFFKKDGEVQKEINFIVEGIENILKPIREDFNSYKDKKDYASFQIRKIIDSSTRAYNFKNGELSSWFTDILIESQYNILYKDINNNSNTYFSRLYLEMLVDCSSELTELGLDTKTVFEDKKFWYGLKVVRENVPPVDYKIFTNYLISNFLTLKSYTDSEKIDIGMDSIGVVIKDELNFKSRLNLWLDIGGGLLLEDKKGHTIVEKLKQKNNAMWNSVIVDIAKERGVNLNKFYPKDFDRPGDFTPTKEEIFSSRKNNNPF